MKKKQIQRLQELNKCYISNRYERGFIQRTVTYFPWVVLSRYEEMLVNRLWNLYQNQIKAIRKNNR